VASQGSENWNFIKEWLQKVHILQGSLKPYDIKEFTDGHISTRDKVPPWIGTTSMESAFQATGLNGGVGGGVGTTTAIPNTTSPLKSLRADVDEGGP
jgi:hypothetical protein